MVKIKKNTLIKIFYDRIGDKRYLAFDLFIYSVSSILKKIIKMLNLLLTLLSYIQTKIYYL